MSKQNLSKFLKQVADSKELQEKIGNQIDSDTLIASGAENGFDFTVDDLTGIKIYFGSFDGRGGSKAWLSLRRRLLDLIAYSELPGKSSDLDSAYRLRGFPENKY